MKILFPVRIQREFTQQLRGTAAQVFPLLCPVREAEWIEGWEPEVVYSRSGHAEEDCAFLTWDGVGVAIWVITRYDRDAGILGFVKTTPEAVLTRIRIELESAGPGRCLAHVSYRQTSLSPSGDGLVVAFTPER